MKPFDQMETPQNDTFHSPKHPVGVHYNPCNQEVSGSTVTQGKEGGREGGRSGEEGGRGGREVGRRGEGDTYNQGSSPLV